MIAQDPNINEVILSGGDPLMARDDHLQHLIEKIDAIAHVRRLRIHTRLPVVIPTRLTDTLAQLLQKTRLQDHYGVAL